MQKGNIGVTTENIFPIIKKFLYSEHEIFLRELVSNAVDATQKVKAMASAGDFKGELGNLTIRVAVDKDAKTLTISDAGIGMTADEINRYINQIAFSSAGEFLDKYKNKIDAIIGHFGLGFYSAFMVSKKVEIVTQSWRTDAPAMRWSCDGTPEFTMEETQRAAGRGTDIILHLDSESEEFADESRVESMLKKYCKFLPIEIGFGKEKEWKDGKYADTETDKIINNPRPLWTLKPVDLKEDDYKKFYRELYPAQHDEPLFNIHINVDYPFNLTGVLYFPRIRHNFEIQKNKIQLYCNQVFVTDSVEGIVPEYLTLLHGVLDSPDIPLNVSRSYLQGDPNVKKISNHITKKVADRLEEIFKKERQDLEKKWDDLKMFMQYGMLSDEKFHERAEKFFLVKNTEGKYFTFAEYQDLVKTNQTDKHNKIVFLYANNTEDQHAFVQAANNKGYDVLIMDGHLDAHFINHVEGKLKDVNFKRVDADIADKLIEREESKESKLSADQERDLRPAFKSVLPSKDTYMIMFEALNENDLPAMITQTEFMRRMKDMSKLGGGAMGYYGELPNAFNLVINTNHPIVSRIINDQTQTLGSRLTELNSQISELDSKVEALEKQWEGKKEEEIPQAEQDQLAELEKQSKELKERKDNIITDYGKQNKLVKQVVDLALLSNNMLKGEDLTKFVRRSIELIN